MPHDNYIYGNSIASWNLSERDERQAYFQGTDAPCKFEYDQTRIFIDKGHFYQFPIHDVNFTCFSPINIPQNHNNDENHCSLITIVKKGDFGFFSLGDATPNNFNTNFPQYRSELSTCRRQYVKLPHHGSESNCKPLLITQDGRPAYPYAPNCTFFISGYGANNFNDTVRAFISLVDSGMEDMKLFIISKAQGATVDAFMRGVLRVYKDNIKVAPNLVYVDA